MPPRNLGLKRPRDHVTPWPRLRRREGEPPVDLAERPFRYVGLGDPPDEVKVHVVGEALRLAVEIHNARRKHGWSKRELADRLGVSVQTLGNIESGRTFPELVTIAMLARELDQKFTVRAVALPATPEPAPPKPTKAELKARQVAEEKKRQTAQKAKLTRLAKKTEGLDKIPGMPDD